MKRIALILGLAILAGCGKAPAPAVIPTPVQERYGCGTLSGNPEPSIEIDDKYLSKYGPEGYNLEVDRRGVRIKAAGQAGAFYALQTLCQISDSTGIRYAKITDKPRFPYRGIHLDVSRHFFPKEEVMKILDEMARYKFNYFHFHFADNGGWRIKLDSCPELTRYGAFRKIEDWDTFWLHSPMEFCEEGTPEAYGGYYTKDEVRQIIEYAAERHIEVIPEVEFPAHSNAVFAAYPDLTCGPEGYRGGEFCVANEGTFEFAEKVLLEIMDLFPSKIVHIGGDEARMEGWENCPKCQKLMKEKGFSKTGDLQTYLISRIQKIILENGHRMAGWDQLLENEDLDSSSIVYAYRSDSLASEAAGRGVNAVITPGDVLYLDWFQAHPHYERKAQYGYSPLHKIFRYEPQVRPNILGVQGCMWTEYVPTEGHLEYMLFPRMLAVSEKGWSEPGTTTWEQFKNKVATHIPELKARGLNVYDQHDMPEIETDGKRVSMDHENPYAEIRYTLDGLEPDAGSQLYTEPFPFRSDTLNIKAAAFSGKNKTFTRNITLVRGKKYTESYPEIDLHVSWMGL